MSDGTILDLVSRGKKDAYQIQDPVRTWFGSPYVPRSPSTREIRLLYPENPPRFGQSFDIVLPSDGDILMSFDLRITLPTWLPPNIVAINKDPKNRITIVPDAYEVPAYPYYGSPPAGFPWQNRIIDPSTFPIGPFIDRNLESQSRYSTEYGWCDGVANYMISRWALFVDNVMILDGYGEFNTYFPDMDTTQLHAPLIHAQTGRTGGTPLGIQTNATLPELVFRVPIPGCQGKGDTGLPLCAFKNQKVYLRFWLLDKTQLVESSTLRFQAPVEFSFGQPLLPLYELCPKPWGRKKIFRNGIYYGDQTLTATEMGQPYIYARTAILNVENELRSSLAAQKFEIRFRQQRRDYWTVDSSAFVPGVNYRRLLQINGLFQSLFLYFRSDARTQQNKYTVILPTNPQSNILAEWLTNLSLNVNGNDRIYPWSPKKFRTLADNTQLGRDVNLALYYLIFGISPENEPGGAFNLSRCQKAALNLSFNNIQPDPMTATNTTYATILGLSWNVLDIKDGTVIMRFPN
jgi:hypothetical protein